MEVEGEGFTETFKSITKKQLYDIMQECPDKKIDDKMLFLEIKMIELTKCPDSKLGQVISHFILPIGQLSEEEAEARNKHFPLYRQNFSRKFDRVQCNSYVLNRLLLKSNPLLSCSRKQPRKKSKAFCSETLSLLLSEADNEQTEDVEDDEKDKESDENGRNDELDFDD